MSKVKHFHLSLFKFGNAQRGQGTANNQSLVTRWTKRSRFILRVAGHYKRAPNFCFWFVIQFTQRCSTLGRSRLLLFTSLTIAIIDAFINEMQLQNSCSKSIRGCLCLSNSWHLAPRDKRLSDSTSAPVWRCINWATRKNNATAPLTAISPPFWLELLTQFCWIVAR